MKTFIYIFILSISFSSLSQTLSPVEFSFESGVYSTALSVSLTHPEPGVSIYYTTDGSEPTTSDVLYSSPLTLVNLNGTENYYSTIPTNPSFNYPIGDYTASRANNRGWLSPSPQVEKAHVIRAKAFKSGFTESETSTKTYLIDSLGLSRYTFPIVSIVVDSMDFFSDENGIYVYGDDPEGNYSNKGEEWERILYFELIENGTSVYAQNCRSRIHGGGSRHSTQKNLRLYGETGDLNNFRYEFFENYELDKFKRLILRSGGHRPDCFPRDNLSQLITDGLNIDKQHFKHVIVFLNGEYWGIHSIKERMDNYFFQNSYGIDDNLITVLDQEYDLQGGGFAADSIEMDNLEYFVTTEDMTLEENYEYVAAKIDVDNYIDYMASEIYLSNSDWVYSNVVIWRKTGAYVPGAGAGHDGKFRWAMYDLDGGFGGACDNAYYTINTLEAATVETGTYSSYTRFFRGMLLNETFRNKFITRTFDLLNSWFKPEVVQEKMNLMYDILTPEILEHTKRWQYPSLADNLADRALETPSLLQWDTTFYMLNRFAERRSRKIREHYMDRWLVTDTSRLTVNVNDQSMGYVQVNSLLIQSDLPGVESTIYPWVGLYMDSIPLPLMAIPKPGYRFVEWENTGITEDTILWIPSADTVWTAIFEADPDFEAIRVNEVMLKNDSYYSDNFSEYDDWSELFNPNPYPVNISGFQLVKGSESWTIPANTTIEANGYFIFWHDKETYQGSNHVTYKLQNVSDYLYLKDNLGQSMDSLYYLPTNTDQSYGRLPNGSDTYTTFDSPTPLMNNDFTGIESENLQNQLVVYPNPTHDKVFFNQRINYFLYDLNGRLVKQGVNAIEMDVQTLNQGIYILMTNQKQTTKIILTP